MSMEAIRYFVPGPVFVRSQVREAMTREIVPHRSQVFIDLYRGLGPQLQQVFRTREDVLVATSSSTFVMESAILSTVGSDVLNLTCGAFSERWHAIARAVGKHADRVSVPWGEAVDPDLVRQALRRKRYEAVTVVHNETSTGVMNPLAEIAAVVRGESDALVLVDAVSSLGGAPVETDAWGLDVVLAGTQKALAVPPGLTVFSFSDRAADRAEKVPVRGFYSDLLRYRRKHKAGGTITTPAIPLVYALDDQLRRILAEGVERRWQRHLGMATRSAEWVGSTGGAMVAAADNRSWTVTCFRPPGAVSAPALVRSAAEAGWTISGGYGEWKPSTVRIGHMGEVQPSDLEGLLAALDECMIGLRREAEQGDRT
ncbi:MAG: alanine--glyoxylate aminotransferase family protein [Acidobacteriota bacterium]|nr:alanine--glyoxylate aminotransferase family protein [Acidobacteriota bacterium]